MNKGTRTWITGILILIASQYYIDATLKMKNNDNVFAICIQVFFLLFFIATSAYGINLVLKSIRK